MFVYKKPSGWRLIPENPSHIVILAAGLGRNLVGQPSRARQLCESAIQLAQKSPDSVIYVTGGKVDIDGKSEAVLLEEHLLHLGWSLARIKGEYTSTDTFYNLQNLEVHFQGVRNRGDLLDIGLVVVAPQSARAARIFRKLYPNALLNVVPVNPKIWNDTAQWGLRSPLLFRLREIAAYVLFFFQGKL
jgi:hypothetical protein